MATGKPRARGRTAAAVALAAPTLLLVALAGCGNPFGEARPEDWQTGAPLTAFAGGKTHGADEQYSLRVASGAVPPTPARCVAYEAGRHASRDDCTVVPGGRTLGSGRVITGWTLEVSFSGVGQDLYEVEQHPERRTAVAFAADGSVVAHWDGLLRDADGEFWTE
jgi:hypothetical protein